MPERERQTTTPAELEETARILAEREERAEMLSNPRELLRRGHAAVAEDVAERTRQRRIARGANPADA